jgi:hypothetical protein
VKKTIRYTIKNNTKTGLRNKNIANIPMTPAITSNPVEDIVLRSCFIAAIPF